MSKIDYVIGQNICNRRLQRGLTQNELAAKYHTVSGYIVSNVQISNWENGRNRLYAYQLEYLAEALDCSPSTLLGTTIHDSRERLHEEVDHMSIESANIFKFMFSGWYGNTKALIKFIGLYMALPSHERKAIAEMGVFVYNACASRNKVVKNAPRVDIAYLENEAHKLW